MVGASESGKSTLARQLFLSAAPPRLVIDPADSEICDVPGAVSFRDPTRFDPNVATARFVPYDPGDLDAYDELYRRVKALGGPRYVWVDEAGLVLPANGTKRWARAVVVQGRKAEIGHLALHTRPSELLVQLKSVLHHLISYPLADPDDRKWVARATGLPSSELDAAYDRLEPFGFLWWQRTARRVSICKPLTLTGR